MIKDKCVKRKLDCLYGKNYSCDCVKENLVFNNTNRFMKSIQIKRRVSILFSAFAVVLLCAVTSIVSLLIDRNLKVDQSCEENFNQFDEFNEYYDEIRSFPVVQIEIVDGYFLKVYEGRKIINDEVESVYLFSVTRNPYSNSEIIIIDKVIINDRETIISGSDTYGIAGNDNVMDVKVYIGERIIKYNFVL